MDALETYRKIIQNLLAAYVRVQYAYGDIHNETIFDYYCWMSWLRGQLPNKLVLSCLASLVCCCWQHKQTSFRRKS